MHIRQHVRTQSTYRRDQIACMSSKYTQDTTAISLPLVTAIQERLAVREEARSGGNRSQYTVRITQQTARAVTLAKPTAGYQQERRDHMWVGSGTMMSRQQVRDVSYTHAQTQELSVAEQGRKPQKTTACGWTFCIHERVICRGSAVMYFS